MKLTIVVILSLAFAWLLCYTALRTAQNIAAASQQRIEGVFQ